MKVKAGINSGLEIDIATAVLFPFEYGIHLEEYSEYSHKAIAVEGAI